VARDNKEASRPDIGPGPSLTYNTLAASAGSAGLEIPMDFEKFLRLMEELRRQRVEYILVGGVALGLLGIVRATEDIDLFIRASEENVAKLRAAMRAVWEDPDIEQISAADLMGEYPTVRYGPPSEEFLIDILARLGEAVRYEVLEFVTLDVEGTPVRVATPRTLYRMKRNTVRPMDRADAAMLKDKFDVGEE